MSKEVTNLEVIVFSVYNLGGGKEPVDTEDVAIRVNDLAPGRFRWRKYPDQINLEMVRVTLSDAKKSQNGCLLGGDGSKGWYLTVAGIQWVSQNQGKFGNKSLGRARIDRELDRRRSVERPRILNLPAWEKFNSGARVNLREAESVFRISEYVKGKRREQLLNRVGNLFAMDHEIGPFMRAMQAIAGNPKEENK